MDAESEIQETVFSEASGKSWVRGHLQTRMPSPATGQWPPLYGVRWRYPAAPKGLKISSSSTSFSGELDNHLHVTKSPI